MLKGAGLKLIRIKLSSEILWIIRNRYSRGINTKVNKSISFWLLDPVMGGQIGQQQKFCAEKKEHGCHLLNLNL